MTVTVEQPLAEPDAGVIEEARARQRRQRRLAGAAMLLAAAIAAILLVHAGDGGGEHLGRFSVSPGRQPSNAARLELASCAAGNGEALRGAPSKSLLAILGVLRRPASAADAGSGVTGGGEVLGVFVNYIRRARVVSGGDYYIYPAILGGCGTRQTPYQGIIETAKNVDLGHGIIGGVGGGGSTASSIEQGREVGTGAPGSSTSTTITMIVPDGVASVTLHYVAGPASGYTRKISPAFTLTTPVVNNLVVVRVPRSSGTEARDVSMIWRASDGHIVRGFNRL
jgi:hypothetical protein